jgi:hypothetical protein
MTVDGFITVVFQVSILTWTQGGERIIETVNGMDITGTMSELPISDCNGNGRTGAIIVIGKRNKPGVFGSIGPGPKLRDRNYDSRGSGNIGEGRKSTNIKSRDHNQGDSLRFNSQDNAPNLRGNQREEGRV